MKIKITAGTAALEDIYIYRVAALEMMGKTFKVEKIYAPTNGTPVEYNFRLASGALYYVHPEHFEIVEPPAKIKITATAKQLCASSIPPFEADRLAGSIQEVIEHGSDAYGVKMATRAPGSPHKVLWWIRVADTVPILDSKPETQPSRVLDLSKPVQTRSGSPVKVLMVCDDPGILYPVVGLIKGASMPAFWNRDGINYTAKDSGNELINVPAKKLVAWVNVYADGYALAYESRADADKYLDVSKIRIACVKVTEGDGLDV